MSCANGWSAYSWMRWAPTNHLSVGPEEASLIAGVCDDVFGFGPISDLLTDDTVTEVMCNGPASVWVERSGRLELTEVRFVDAGHLRRVIDKMVGGAGRRIDESTPLCDARLASGARINAVVAPVAVGGPFLTVRKFSADALGIHQLLAAGTLDPVTAEFLAACGGTVQHRGVGWNRHRQDHPAQRDVVVHPPG